MASYREMEVWRRGIELSVAIYKLTSGFPKEELYGLTSQMRRCSVSVASNIAEGYGRSSRGEFKHFLGISRGSTLELQTQLVIASKLGFGDTEHLVTAEGLADEVGKMIWALLKKIEANKNLSSEPCTLSSVTE